MSRIVKIEPIALGNDQLVKARLAELDRDIMDAGISYFTAREVCKVRYPAKIRMPAPCYSIPPLTVWDSMLTLLEKVAVPIREEYGEPLKVLNGFRAYSYNMKVTESLGSKHVRFEALDLVGRDMKRLRAIAADFFIAHPEMKLGFGFYLGNIHVDMGSRRRNTFWGSQARRELDAARDRRRSEDNTAPIDVREREYVALQEHLDDLLDDT